MKTTIIKILNQIANGEEPPKKIIIRFKKYNERDEIFEYVKEYNDYFDEHGDRLFEDYDWIDMLNDEVEILETTITYKQDNIENNKQDKIEKIDVFSYDKCIHGVTHKEKELALEIRYTQIKINELIDRVNE